MTTVRRKQASVRRHGEQQWPRWTFSISLIVIMILVVWHKAVGREVYPSLFASTRGPWSLNSHLRLPQGHSVKMSNQSELKTYIQYLKHSKCGGTRAGVIDLTKMSFCLLCNAMWRSVTRGLILINFYIWVEWLSSRVLAAWPLTNTPFLGLNFRLVNYKKTRIHLLLHFV